MLSKILLAVSILGLVFQRQILAEEDCASMTTCNDCITTPGCAWCASTQYTKDRCSKRSSPLFNCPDDKIQYPEPEVKVTTVKYAHEVSPPQLNVTARIGVPVKIEVEYFDVENKPVDLYYLVDVSATMLKARKTVASQADDLKRQIEKITTKVRLGFGTFVDKPIYPFADYAHINSTNETIESTYAFKHHLSLTNATEMFKTELESVKNSANYDSPEGGLEALIQVLVCNEKIGWADNTRLVVFNTDGPFKLAGDARLVGILTPNDGKCHLNEKNDYTHALKQDYPSVNMIRRLISESGTHVIFAVTEVAQPFYKRLLDKLPRARMVTLKDDAKDIAQKVTDTYLSIESRVTMKVTKPDDILVSTQADCFGVVSDTDTCSNITTNSKVKFTFTMTLSKSLCNSPADKRKVVIQRFGGGPPLKINFDPICECNCDNSKEDDSLCNGKGTIDCGKCKCRPPAYGDFCQCDDVSQSASKEDQCKNKCHRGTCNTCGMCDCGNDRYRGTFCEIDLDDCRPGRDINIARCWKQGVCNPDNASCICNSEYSGKFCNCVEKEDSCKAPDKEDVCSGNGRCVCPEDEKTANVSKTCECNVGYDGRFCEACHKCTGRSVSPICDREDIKNSVKCFSDQKSSAGGPAESDGRLRACQQQLGGIGVTLIRPNTQINVADSRTLVSCPEWEDVGCYLQFTYDYVGKDLRIYLKQAYCPPSQLWLIVWVAGPLVLIGILTLLFWKICTSWMDRREFQRFEKETQDAKWSQAQNPLYNGPLSEFQNPAFRKSRLSQMFSRKSHQLTS